MEAQLVSYGIIKLYTVIYSPIRNYDMYILLYTYVHIIFPIIWDRSADNLVFDKKKEDCFKFPVLL